MSCFVEKENVLLTNKHVFACLVNEANLPSDARDLQHAKDNFCGQVVTNLSDLSDCVIAADAMVFLSGDVKNILDNYSFASEQRLCVIHEYSNYSNITEQ